MSPTDSFINTTSQYLVPEAISKFNIPEVNPGDILLSFKLTLGRTGIASCKMYTNEAIACFRHPGKYQAFLYCILNSFDYENGFESTSSIGKAFNSSILKNMEIVFPTDEELNYFNMTAEPLISRMKYLNDTIIELEKIKSQLLKKYF